MPNTEHDYDDNDIHHVATCRKCQRELAVIEPPFATPETCDDQPEVA